MRSLPEVAPGANVPALCAQRYGADYRYANPVAASDSAWFKFNIPGTGNYEVSVWYPANAGYNASTPYVIATSSGNVTRTEGPLFIDIFMVGEVAREELLLRGGARAGDQILVTGFIGDAAAGLYLAGHPEVRLRNEAHTALTFALLRPIARVEAGRAIASLRRATSMIDVSDGLAGDLGHLCRASGVGAVIWEHELPVSPSALELASVIRKHRPEEWALYGGEDYQLLLTAPVEAVPALQKAVREAGGIPLTLIGEAVPAAQGIRLKRGEDLLPLEGSTWDHLRGEGE